MALQVEKEPPAPVVNLDNLAHFRGNLVGEEDEEGDEEPSAAVVNILGGSRQYPDFRPCRHHPIMSEKRTKYVG